MSHIDSSHSWVVALAGFFIYLLGSCPLRLASQLFVCMLDRYDITRKEASFPFVLAQIIRSVSGTFAGLLGEIFGLQTVTIFGCLLCTVGVGGCFFAENILTVNICLGLLYGIGYSWSSILIPEILNHHFKKHRSKSYGLFLAGGALGAFFIPPILDITLKEFGVSGTFLVMGAILFNSVPAAMLLTIPKKQDHSLLMSGTTAKVTKEEVKGRKIIFLPSNDRTNSLVQAKLKVPFDVAPNNDTIDRNSGDMGQSMETIVPAPKLPDKEIPTKATKFFQNLNEEESNEILGEAVLSTNNSCKYSSLSKKYEVSSFMTSNNSNINEISEIHSQSAKGELFMKNSNASALETSEVPVYAKQSLFVKFSVIWSPVFLLIATTLAFAFCINQVFWTITVDLVRDKGIEQHLEVYFVMCLALFDTVGRLLLGSITDKGLLTITNFTICCHTIFGFVFLSLVWLPEFFSLMVAFSLLGLTFGGNTISMPALITNFIEKEKRTIAMASRFIITAPLNFAISPAIGFFRGSLGTYDGLLYVMAAMCFVSVVMLLVLPILAKRRDRMQMKDNL